MPFGLTLYRLLTRFVSPLLKWLLHRRVRQGKEDAARLHERFAQDLPPRPEGPLIWLHGASVGESQILLAVGKELLKHRADLTLLFTCQTQTAANLIRAKLVSEPSLAQNSTLQQMAALDTPAISQRFIDHWRPGLAVFAEGEIWPNLLTRARAHGVKTALINARMTEKSILGWQRWPKTARILFGGFDLLLASDLQTATGLTEISGSTVPVIGNLKSALPPPDVDVAELKALETLFQGRKILLGASTHPGEEALLIDALMRMEARPVLILAPRHPERGDEIRRLIELSNLNVSQRTDDEPVTPETDILLADTMGEMGLWYRLADTVYLGGGHAPGIGGHNPLEALQLGKPVLTGPSVFNFKDMMADLERKSAIQFVADGEALIAAFPAPPLPDTLVQDLSNGSLGPMNQTIRALTQLLPAGGAST